MSYNVVLLDGKELHNLSFEQVKDLFLKRQINQTSLIRSAENPQWQMLKRAFDILQWMPANLPETPPAIYQPPGDNPFVQSDQTASNPFEGQTSRNEQPNPPHQPVTFNQFPPNQSSQHNDNFANNTSNGHSQNNQCETYYQAETSQSQYNFQNNQANVAPSNYRDHPTNYDYSPKDDHHTNDRNGLQPAAVFLVVNALLNIILMVVENLFLSAQTTPSPKIGNGGVRFVVSLVIDLILVVKLWQKNDIESVRKWVLIRTYLGFLIFGIITPCLSVGTDGLAVGVITFAAYFLFFISILLVLHGKQSPSPSRVMTGIATFAIFFLFHFGILALSAIAALAPNLRQFDIADKQFDKYKIEGTEFQDKTTGAKVVLPEGWIMLELNNPLIHTPEARMIAVDKPGNRLTMLEVVPVPGNLDMKQANSASVLDQLANGVVESLKRESESGGFYSKDSFREVARLNIYIGKHPARLLVFDKTTGREKVKGHLIITFDELTFYVLHSWCPAAEYDQAQSDFTFFEKNFTVPEKLNSPFTQSADNEKKKANQNGNY